MYDVRCTMYASLTSEYTLPVVKSYTVHRTPYTVHRTSYIVHRTYLYLCCMNTYKGVYNIEGSEDQPASVTVLKDKLVIEIKDEYNNPRKVFWMYENIVQENFWKTGKAVVRTKHYPPQVI